MALTILLDTNAYEAFKRAVPSTLEILNHAEIIGINSVVLGELLAGFAGGSKQSKNLAELNQFLQTPRVRQWSIDQTTAKYYAIVYQQLKRKGRPIPTNDIWIAATALQHGLALFTYDKHFSDIDQLRQGQQLSHLLSEEGWSGIF